MIISWEKYCFKNENKIKKEARKIKAIYKIENKINHKIYIGQTNNPDRRFYEHCNIKTKYKSLIHDAIIKYGEENFTFKVLEWCDDFDKKEQEYIEKYRSLVPNGYNICIGGDNPPHGNGENNNFSKISNEVAFNIKNDLKNFNIPRKSIAKKYNVSFNIIRHINEGTSWYDEHESYPLRPTETVLNKIKAQKIIEDLILTDIPMNQLGGKYGWGRSAAKMINQGINHRNDKLFYPIRNNKEKNKAILNL